MRRRDFLKSAAVAPVAGLAVAPKRETTTDAATLMRMRYGGQRVGKSEGAIEGVGFVDALHHAVAFARKNYPGRYMQLATTRADFAYLWRHHRRTVVVWNNGRLARDQAPSGFSSVGSSLYNGDYYKFDEVRISGLIDGHRGCRETWLLLSGYYDRSEATYVQIRPRDMKIETSEKDEEWHEIWYDWCFGVGNRD